MKESNYNYFVPFNNRIICFNGISGKVFSVSNEEYSWIEECIKLPDKEGQLRNFLYKNNFIIDNNLDEVELIKLNNRLDVFDRTFQLIINPTLECNFACWYCYEKNIKGSMSNETIENVKRFLENKVNRKEISGLQLGWFGGEPLLHFNKVIYPISSFAKELMKQNNLTFKTGITTNGFLINDNMIEKFKEIELKSFQITLDGDKISHDKTRNQKGKPSFDKIIDNISKLCKSLADVHVRLRINYTNEILQQNFKDIFSKFSIADRSKITIDFQRVWQTANEVKIPGSDNQEIISKINLSREMGFNPLINTKYTVGKSHQCYVDRYNFAHLNYDGKIYKCTARDYSEKYVCGKLLNNGEISWKSGILEKMYSKANFENDICLPCKMLPICTGPCFQSYLEYKNGENNDICIHNHKEVSVETFIVQYYISVKKIHEKAV
jgi:uncharacterized protein